MSEKEQKPVSQALMAGLIAMGIWLLVSPMIMPQREDDQAAPPTATTQPSGSAGSTASTSSPSSGPATVRNVEGVGTFRLVGADGPETVTLGGADPESPYRLELECDNRGAAIRRVALSDHAAEVLEDERYQLLLPAMDNQTGDEYLSFAALSLRFPKLNNLSLDLSKALWAMTRSFDREQNKDVVTFELTVEKDGQPFAKVTRRIELAKHPVRDLKKSDPERLRHDVQIHTDVENLTDEPQDMVLSFLGPVGLKREDFRSDQRRLVAAVGPVEELEFEKRERRKVFDASEKSDKISGGELLPFLYGTAANKFFYAIVAPVPSAEGDDITFSKVDAVVLTSNDSNTASEVTQRGDLTFRFTSDVLTVPAKSSRHLSLDCFLGPKSRAAFNKLSPYKDRHYSHLVEAEYYWCAPVSLSNVMITLFLWIHSIPPHNFGIAIIMLVLLVRTILHPITKKTQVNMVKMQENMAVLQPKIEEVKKKYANDKQKLQQATMEVYRDSGVNPANNILGCLPMLLQMPVWGALWTALSFTTEMRHEGFVFWIRDLTAPDALIQFDTIYNIPLMGPTSSFNLLPLFLGLSMYLQQKFMPKASRQAKKDRMSDDQLAQQEQMQKMMLIIMPIMMMVLFYNAPSGLTLYIMSSSFFGMIEQWRIRQHIKEKKEQEGEDTGKKGQGGIKKPRFLKKLERLAEEAKQQQSNRTKPGKRKNPRPGASR